MTLQNNMDPPQRRARHIEITSNQLTIREILSTNIYSNPLAGIREMYANSCNSCKTAESKYETDPSIHITYDYHNKNLVIEDTNAMGMTRDIFDNVYSILGKSSNSNGRLQGQFGIGMAAYYCLSDIMIIESYSRETEDRFICLGKSVEMFEDISKSTKFTLEKYGVKITMTLRQNKTNKIDVVKSDQLIEYVKKLAAFTGVRTLLTVKNNHESGIENGTIEIGMLNPKNSLGLYDKRPKYIEIDNDHYHLIISLDKTSENITRLVGIPITIDQKVVPFDKSFYLNVKNERQYIPTATRDTLTNEATDNLKKQIKNDIKQYMLQQSWNSMKSFYNNPFRYIYEDVKKYDKRIDTKKFIDFLQTSNLEFIKYGKNIDSRRTNGWNDIDNEKHILVSNSKNTKRTKILQTCPDDVLLVIPHGNTKECAKFMRYSKKYGLKNIQSIHKHIDDDISYNLK